MRLSAPERAWCCPYQLLGIGSDRVLALFGVDAMQALVLGLREDIVHVQIEKGGRLELAAYDNFHPQCVVTGPAVPSEVLAELQAAGVVRGFVSISR